MKHVIFSLALLLGTFNLLAQKPASADGFWTDLQTAAVEIAGKTPPDLPLRFRLLELDADGIRQRLNALPLNYDAISTKPTIGIELPMPDGTFETFTLYNDPIMEPALARRYPEIITLAGHSTRNHGATVRLDLSPHGFNAQVLSPGHNPVYIRPVAVGNDRIHLSYFKKDARSSGDWQCFTEGHSAHPEGWKELLAQPESVGDCGVRHEYRLALCCSGEYAAFHGGTVALALAAMNTTMNRVNGVFEIDFAIRMNLIANTDLLIYLDAATDPFPDPTDAGATINQNQSNTDLVIGSGNYDLGHVFTTGSGGLAQLQATCNGGKARATTGQGNPIGDAFDIDYVAHEMGHQFGGDHTQYNACNRNDATAVEPGSGSTIMGYAGICAPDVQPHSDPYFHTVNVVQIRNYVASGGGSSCDNAVAVSNSAPTVAPLASYSIPVSTPFVLTASASDPDGNALTYCWEQTDAFTAPMQTMPPAAANISGPMFRSLNPSTSPSRYFPNLNEILTNGNPTWEKLPAAGRTMNFTVTARDNSATAGCTGEANTTITVVGTAGPFKITSLGSSEFCLFAGDPTTIAWDVANTNVAPINCTNVDIWLSTDGGLNFSTLLLANTPNDGSEAVVIPVGAISEQGRIMVRGAGNVFFDVNDRNVRIDCPLNRTVTDNPASGRYRARETVSSLGTVTVVSGSTAEFFAGTEVLLRPGFTAELGSNFIAEIRACDPCSASRPEALLVAEEFVPEVIFIEKAGERDIADGNSADRPFAARVYPNPFNQSFTVEFTLSEAGPVNIDLVDLTGRTIMAVLRNDERAAGQHSVRLQSGSLPAGIYTCRISAASRQEQLRLVKVD